MNTKITHVLTIITLFIIVYFCANIADATTYYVRASGSTPTSPYTSWETAAAIPDSAVAAGNQDRGGDSQHKIFIAPGTYYGRLNFNDSDWAGGTVTGLASTDTTTTAAKNQVIIMSGGNHTLVLSAAGITVNNITLTNGSGSYDAIYCSASNCAGNYLYAYNSARALVNVTAAGGLTLNRSEFAGTKTASTAFNIQSTADSLKMNYCVVCNSDSFGVGGTTISTGCVRNSSNTATVTLNNCYISGAQYYAVINSGTGTTNLNNCILTNNGYVDATGAVLYNGASGTLNTTNCLIAGNPFSQNTTIDDRIYNSTSIIGKTNNVAAPNRYPRFKNPARKGFIVPCVDDLTKNGIAYAEQVAALFKQHGVTGTYFADMFNWATGNYATRAIALNDDYWTGGGGLEVGAHSRSHANLRLSDGIPALKHGGIITPESATITFDRTLDRILIGTDTLTVGTTKTYKNKTWSEIKTALTAAGCTLAADTTFSPSGVKSTMLGEIFQDSGGAQTSGYIPKIYIPSDSTKWATEGFLYSELVDAKANQEVRYGRTVYSFATPYGTVSDTVRTVASAAGYNGLRRALSTTGTAIASYKLSNLNVMDQNYLSWEYWVDPACGGEALGDTIITKELMEWLCDYVEQTGAIIYILAHHQSGETYPEAPIAHWAAVLGVINQHPTITCCSMYEAMNAIKKSDEWAAANEWTYTRSWTSTADYRLQSLADGNACNSPALDAGSNTIFAEEVRDKNNRLPNGIRDINPYEMTTTTPAGAELSLELVP